MSTPAVVLPPPLRDGDRLTRDEFLRRWEAMPDVERAELIDGIVYMPSPVSLDHGDFQTLLSGWLVSYAALTPGCRPTSEATWLLGDDVPQPGLVLRILPEHGGQSGVEGKYGAGAPELVAEVAVSSRSRDLGPKLRLYQRTGVREYITALVQEQKLVWRELVEGKFLAIEADDSGILRSRVFPGLWLDPAALWRLDSAAMIACIDKGTATPEHAAFVRGLTARRA